MHLPQCKTAFVVLLVVVVAEVLLMQELGKPDFSKPFGGEQKYAIKYACESAYLIIDGVGAKGNRTIEVYPEHNTATDCYYYEHPYLLVNVKNVGVNMSGLLHVTIESRYLFAGSYISHDTHLPIAPKGGRLAAVVDLGLWEDGKQSFDVTVRIYEDHYHTVHDTFTFEMRTDVRLYSAQSYNIYHYFLTLKSEAEDLKRKQQ